MYLKHLEIHGFKTFADRTQIVFTPGITCVVGPNGSGKSNISDAILWVLGENNVRSLRGSVSQDVIFAGNDRRRPLGMAEVSLTIDNRDGILPLDFSEITVTRRVYRSGEGEYFINKVACRLRDIYELFLDTGVGRDAYSMINQGEIDQILSVRAEDRRAIFEEAAGIKKYRVRKREAERKLEHTQQNLLRVNDIIAEIEGQLGPLQRQATAARRYHELAGRLRVLEDAFYGARLRRLNAERESLSALVSQLREERARLEAELGQAQAAEKLAREQLQQLEARGEQLRGEETAGLQRIARAEAEKARAEERAAEVQRRLRVLDKELDELAGRIRDQLQRAENADRDELALRKQVEGARAELGKATLVAQEKAKAHEAASRELERRRQAWLARARREAELEARVQSGEQRVRGLEQQVARAKEALEDAEAELERLRVERESFLQAAEGQKEKSQSLGAGLEKLREAVRAGEKALAEARTAADQAGRALNTHQARLQALSELGERGEGAAEGARKLLDGVRRGQVRGSWSLLVAGFRVPEGLEKAVEAALGIYADALLCETPGQALAGLEWLRKLKTSALMLPGLPPAAEPLPDSLGARIEGSGAAAEWARYLLARAVVCDSLESALEGPAGAGAGAELLVTREGAWRAVSGALSGGPTGADGAAAAVLSRQRELVRLKEELPGLETAATAAREGLKQREGELGKAQGTVRAKQTEWEAARLEQQAQSREADRRNADVERARHRAERLRQDLSRVDREREMAAGSLRQAREEQAKLQAPEAEAGAGSELTEGAVTEAQEESRRLEAERREAERVVSDLRVRLAELDQRLQGASAAVRRAAEAGSFLDRQRADRLNEQRVLTAEREQRQLSFGTLAQEVTDAQAAVAQAREALAALAEERATRTGEVNASRTAGQELNARLRELMERTHRAEVELAALDQQRQHLGQAWLEAAAAAQADEEKTGTEEPETEVPTGPAAAEAPTPEPLTVERLLREWDPAEAELTLSSYSDPEAEINRLRRQIRSLGAVNPDAVEQHAAAKERHEFLTTQRADLEAAREDLEGAVRDIDAASRETFLRAFNEIAAAFDEMFKKLFGGGTTELRLTDPADVLETGIEIFVQPPGKKQQNLLLLSGGERALTAAAMLFALLKVRPSPFCVMDEVDAPLDEHNVGRFTQLLREFSERTQFIMVTHNRGTMEGADTLYGVTMQERGVSTVLSCTLDDPVVAQVEAEARAH